MNPSPFTTYSRLLKYAKPYRWRIGISIVASIGIAASDAILAKLVQPFIDRLVVAGDRDLAQWVPIMVIGVACLKGGSMFAQRYFVSTAGQLTLMDIRNVLFNHLVHLSMRFYSRTSVGTLISRLLNDVNVMQAVVSEVLVSAVRDSITLVALIGVALYTDWKMTLIALLVLPLTAAPMYFVGQKIKTYSRREQEAMSVLTTVLEQAFSGIKVVKSFCSEQKSDENFRVTNLSCYNFLRKIFKYRAVSSPILEIISAFGVAGVLWFGLDRALSGDMTQGELFSVLAAILLMYAPLKRLTRVNNHVQQAMSAAERVFEILDLPNDVCDKHNAVDVERLEGTISFNNVNFAYEEDLVLKDFNLEVSPGQVIALVGPSGAGKSTLIGLLSRYFDPVSGNVEIDGIDISSMSQMSLRNNLALVDQDTFLFNETIRSNIAYGKPEASEIEIAEAAKLAYADEFIQLLPEQYETDIGNRGLNISGGQRQRICIARAILKNAPILLLDEATSALDTESEAKVQLALANLMKGRTTLVIAHRLSTIMHADKIVVMDQGRIVEVGTHQQLLNSGGLYQRLYELQFA